MCLDFSSSLRRLAKSKNQTDATINPASRPPMICSPAELMRKSDMPDSDYHFVDRWRVEGNVKEVADIIEDALSLPVWWPSVYFEVKELEPGGEHGIGKLISLRAGGWLPYTLCINFRTTEVRYPNGFSMVAMGDLEGKGIWTF